MLSLTFRVHYGRQNGRHDIYFHDLTRAHNDYKAGVSCIKVNEVSEYSVSKWYVVIVLLNDQWRLQHRGGKSGQKSKTNVENGQFL